MREKFVTLFMTFNTKPRHLNSMMDFLVVNIPLIIKVLIEVVVRKV